MKIIRPITIADSMLTGSNVPENDYAIYNAATTYVAGDRVILTAGIHMIYESLLANNKAHYPPDNLAGSSPWWAEVSPTNRWKVFDEAVGAQTSQATSIKYRITPGEIFDSMAFLNLDAVSIDVVVINGSADLVTNGKDWTGATGTTPPDNWSKVGSPTGFLIDSGSLRITAAAASEGISQTIPITPGTEMELLGIYRNTAGDIAQYAIYDVTHAADILAKTDLPSSTVDSIFSYVFAVPDGCTSIKISLMAKTGTDIVWFDSVGLAPTVYNESIDLLTTVVTGSSEVYDWYTYFFSTYFRIGDAVKFDLTPYLYAIVDITINYAGGTALCGGIVLGLQTTIGKTLRDPQAGIHDYSVKAADEFGVYKIVERSFSKRATLDVKMKPISVDNIHMLLSHYRGTALIWVGHSAYSTLIIYGYYKDFNIVMSTPNSILSLEIEGLT